MNGTERRCPKCGMLMTQTGAFDGVTRYKCKGCGYMESVQMEASDNTVFQEKRADLLARVGQGVIDWKITQWDYLRRDIQDFMAHYDDARHDIHFHMALIACFTCGFRDMNNEIYKECKTIFKLTERLYKQHCKLMKKSGGGNIRNVERYEEYRSMYKACRNDYRNTKIAWKIAFSLVKTVLPKI